MDIDFGARLQDRIDALLAQRRAAVASVRRNYETGNITTATDLRGTRRAFRIITGQLERTQRELAAWNERRKT